MSPAARNISPHTSPDGARGFNPHLAFFDRSDERISLRETHLGLRRIGLGQLIALPGTALIHLGVAGLGIVRGNWQNPLQLSIPSAGMLRHPDTALVDKQAVFDPTHLNEVFAQYGRQHAGDALTPAEIVAMACTRLLVKTRGISDLLLLPGGVAGTLVEWGALFWLAGELERGQRVLTKHATLRFYTDPDFFHDVARRLELVRQRRARSASGSLRNLVQDWLL